MVCVCVWNSFFKFDPVCVQGEIDRQEEHRSGMHISSYIAAHMMQTLLCLAEQ